MPNQFDSVFSNFESVGSGLAWNNPLNAQYNDNTYSTISSPHATGDSQYLKCTGVGINTISQNNLVYLSSVTIHVSSLIDPPIEVTKNLNDTEVKLVFNGVIYDVDNEARNTTGFANEYYFVRLDVPLPDPQNFGVVLRFNTNDTNAGVWMNSVSVSMFWDYFISIYNESDLNDSNSLRRLYWRFG